MAVAWVAGTTQVVNDNSTTINATTPAGISDGDTLLAAVFARSAITPPAGWTSLIETAVFTGGGAEISQRLAVFSKDTVTSGNSSTSYTWTQADGGETSRMGVVYAVASGVDTITSDSVTESESADDWTITPDTLTASGDALLLCFMSTIFGGISQTATPPTSFTLFSGGTQANYRLGAARRAVTAGQGNSGTFSLNSSPDAGDLGINNGNGAITLLLSSEETPAIEGIVQAASPLGAVAVLGVHARAGLISAPSPLGAALVLAVHDFTEAIAGLRSTYVLDMVTPGGDVRVPISAWQATLRAGVQSYVQCNIPACAPWIDDITAATEFVISRRVVLTTGETLEYEMARAPADNPSLAQGPRNYTATLTGYSEGFAEVADPPTATDRTLADVRSVFTSTAGLRVRCAIDWLLRPGQRALLDGEPFIVGRISYYCADGDQYMDVGENVDSEA
jgi:hypothetical protein